MRTHPKHKSNSSKEQLSKQPPSRRRYKRTPACELKQDGGGFLTLLLERISLAELNGLNQRKHPAGRPIRLLERGPLLAALLFHYTVTWAGTFAEHLFVLLGISMSESTLSERRQALPFCVFEELLRRVLRPIVGLRPEHPASYKEWRLAGLDGVNFSLANTKQINRTTRKGANQRGKAAFAKLPCAVLLELALHNPLAAALGRQGESEWKLALGLLDQVPERCLLLADRLYGCAAFIVAAMTKLIERQSHFLVRVKEKLKARPIKRLADGSQLVEVNALVAGDTHKIAATVVVREIRATIKRRGMRTVHIRLWTSLLDPKQGPAEELLRLYMSRWEQELYFRELKRELGINDLLRSQTVDTAAQEVAAMIIGGSLIAHERATLKPGEGLQQRISFIKTWETLEPLWLTLLLGADLLTEEQKQQLCERFYQLAARRAMAKKRTRSCPRVMRQPFQPWPRKRRQKTVTSPLRILITRRA
jgi:hypothetical protein